MVSPSPQSTAPSTPHPSSATEFKTIIYNPTTHPLPRAHISALRDLINPAYHNTERRTFSQPRIPDEEAVELLTPGRWILCLYASAGENEGGLEGMVVTDHLGASHDLSGWGLVGTISVSRHKRGTVETEAGPGPPFGGEGEGEWHIYLLGTLLNMPKAGLGARLLQEAFEFGKDSGEPLVGYSIVEVGNVEYYKRRGFEEVEGGRVEMGKGAWGCTVPFTLARMVKVS